MNWSKVFHYGNKTQIELTRGDITKVEVDAIVNAANITLLGGGGVDGAIHNAAGDELLEECRMLKGCAYGEAKITKGYKLPAKHVIHTVGPIWRGGDNNEFELLSNCYVNSLHLAKSKKLKSIAFPNISTGIYRFPKEKAAEIALRTVKEFVSKDHNIEKIVFVAFDEENYDIYQRLMETGELSKQI